MRLLLLHGPGINSSRLKLTNLKKDFDPLDVVVYEEGSDVETIKGGLMTLPLLSEQRLAILENPLEDFIDYPLPTTHYQLILWFDHEVSEKKPVMEWVKGGGQIFYFPESKEVSVFPFLDYLTAGDKKAFLEMDKLKKAGFDSHYLIAMVFYLLRNLVATPQNAPQFVRDKLQRQRRRFSLEDIKGLYKEILEIDLKIKSGLLEKEQAEFLLVNLFCH